MGAVVAVVACGSSVSELSGGRKPVSDASVDTSTGGAAAGCVSDIECKGARICQSGVCVDPPSAGGRSPVMETGGAPARGGTGGGPSTGGVSPFGGAGGGIVFTGGGGADASVPDDSGLVNGCSGVRETPETIVVYRDATVTDTVVTYKPVALFFMVDRSGSMVTGYPPPACSCSWDNATAAITAFVNDPSSAGIDVGLGTFPYGPNNTASCGDGADCGTPVVPIASLPGNANAMVQAMGAQKPSTPTALTPTECGLRGMINTCLNYMAQSRTGEQCVGVLVTDGTPTQCDTTQADLVQIVADGHSKGVTTFTLGLQGSDLNALNQLAQAGGTNAAIDVSAGSQQFIDALKNIRNTVGVSTTTVVRTPVTIATPVPCEWRLPPPPSGSVLDPNRLNFEYTPQGGAPRIIGRVASASDCSAVSSDAWYYDDNASPTRISLCPRACADIGQSSSGTVTLMFGCATVPAR